ncbi:hypothetical protein CQ010_10125 [Arthrobacter sp. MYb211]|uniref:phosphatase PAP2 family protein n=1 Tax=unclassified Arthrobacter TaxID=235627 RepID=UPI000CFC3F21|nr:MULTISPECIES: phosphatase PAP2 family protein [unclassified Arthrobacter]PRA11211.1 hypothetical protein CQ015_10015 [Arthrobacter sp. MYb221]PRC07617.1 hypothetical protein CQ010_10125 [Arthrobacter sp. MYb211]
MSPRSFLLAPRHLRWWWALVLLAGLFAVEYLFFVQLRVGQWADQAAFVGWTQWWPRTEILDPVREFLNLLPWICAGISGIFLLYRVIRDRSFLRAALAVAAVAAALLSTQILKHLLLGRPDFNFGTAGNSFPSGHTTAAAAAMGLMYLISPPKLRPVVQPIAWIFATATGLATLICGWHRPSDIAGGFLIVAFWLVLASAILQRIQPLAPVVSESAWSRKTGIGCLVIWFLVLAASVLLPHPHIQRIPEALLIAYAILGLVHVTAVSLIAGLCLRSVILGPTRQLQN